MLKTIKVMKKISNQIFESTIDGTDEATKIVIEWRSKLFKKMSDVELVKFRKTIAQMLDLKIK